MRIIFTQGNENNDYKINTKIYETDITINNTLFQSLFKFIERHVLFRLMFMLY